MLIASRSLTQPCPHIGQASVAVRKESDGVHGSQSHVGYTSLAIKLRGSDVALILNKQRHQAAMCAIVVRP